MNIKWIVSRVFARIAPVTSAKALRPPVFIVGFNKSGKTLLKNILATHPDVIGYPGEANELWHPGYYPWHKSDLSVPPIWHDPSMFVKRSLAGWNRQHRMSIRARLGAYQKLSGKRVLLVDSAMIAFMVPDLLELFPGASFIHFYRDGRICSYVTARREHAKIQKNKAAYQRGGYDFEEFDNLSPKLASYWAATIAEMDRNMDRLSAIGARSSMELSYEEFCADPSDSLNRIFEFLDIPAVQLRAGHIVNANDKVLDEIPGHTRTMLLEVIGPTLRKKGYIASPQHSATPTADTKPE